MAFTALQEDQLDAVISSLETLKTQVQNWNNLAEKWAENPEDVEVVTGQYSALHHALKAASDRVAAQTAKTDAETALASVQQIFDNFDDRYLGSKASDPSTDNDGDALSAGMLYWNSTAEELRFYNGAVWEAPSAQAATSATNAQASEQKAADWAEENEDVEVETGQYSAKHHALKALASAQGASTSATNALASEQKAADWAEENEDVEVETGQYSAKHHALKAAEQALLALQGIKFDDTVDTQANLPAPPPEGHAAVYYIEDSNSGAVYNSNTTSWDVFSMGSITVENVLTSNSTSNALSAAMGKHLEDNKLETSLKGANNGLAELDGSGKVPSGQLPAFVDDVLEYADFASFPGGGEGNKLYVALDTNKVYRWSGSAYVEVSESLALGETAQTAYRGDRGKTAYDHSQQTSGNPHNITKSNVGLSNVPNLDTTNAVNHVSDTDDPHGTKEWDWTSKSSNYDVDEAETDSYENTSASAITGTVISAINKPKLFAQSGAGVHNIAEDTGVTIIGATATDGQGTALLLTPTSTANIYNSKLVKLNEDA